MLDAAAVGKVQPDAGERAFLLGEQMHGERLETVGRDQLDVVVQEQEQVVIATMHVDDLVMDPPVVERARARPPRSGCAAAGRATGLSPIMVAGSHDDC